MMKGKKEKKGGFYSFYKHWLKTKQEAPQELNNSYLDNMIIIKWA